MAQPCVWVQPKSYTSQFVSLICPSDVGKTLNNQAVSLEASSNKKCVQQPSCYTVGSAGRLPHCIRENIVYTTCETPIKNYNKIFIYNLPRECYNRKKCRFTSGHFQQKQGGKVLFSNMSQGLGFLWNFAIMVISWIQRG